MFFVEPDWLKDPTKNTISTLIWARLRHGLRLDPRNTSILTGSAQQASIVDWKLMIMTVTLTHAERAFTSPAEQIDAASTEDEDADWGYTEKADDSEECNKGTIACICEMVEILIVFWVLGKIWEQFRA